MMDDQAREVATQNLLTSFKVRRSRQALLKSAAAAGLAAAGAGLLGTGAAHATNKPVGNPPPPPPMSPDSAATILTVARTAEQLAVTFYSNGVANADKLGLTGLNLDDIKAALIEEQIHLQFFAANGGQSLADTFSFPSGAVTFTSLSAFIATQQQLEGVFDSAFLAAVKEFAELGSPRLAQIAAQIAMIESEHRALGRQIIGADPADNWAFAPVLVHSVGEAPSIVAGAGYLSPTTGNSYKYQPIDFTDPTYSTVYGTILYKTPFTVSGD